MLNITRRGETGQTVSMRGVTPFGDLFSAYDPFWAFDMLGDAFANMWPRFMGADVLRKDGVYTIEVPVPGFKPDQIDIILEGKVIEINARGDKRFLNRSFTIMENFDPNKVNASVENGILTIELGTQREGERKHIHIGGAEGQGRQQSQQSPQQQQQPGRQTGPGGIETSRREGSTTTNEAEERTTPATTRNRQS